ncbi:uncharacterized protein LOC144567604 isoform X2 [Carex rostrata]
MMSFSIEVDKEVYENYFCIADSNGDGKISGPEAVAFFHGSKLPREVLAQIWIHADQDNKGFLDRLGFYNALKLVSVAQQKGYLTAENINHALSVQSKIPAPKINLGDATCCISKCEDSTEADAVKWPKFSESDISKYAEIFRKMDRDKDGKITGEQARILFLSWKMPKGVLRDIWTLSDCDRDGDLSFFEFCIAVYFMERHREGFSLPISLPDTVRYDETLLKATNQAEEDLQMAIKASIQTAIQEGVSVLQPCDSFGGTDMPSPSTPTACAPDLHKFGANPILSPSTNSAPSAPPLDSFSFLSVPYVDNFGTTEFKSSQIEEWESNCVNLGLCSICIENPVEGACIPCGHMAGCMGCLQKIKNSGGECPICRAKIVWIIKLYAV